MFLLNGQPLPLDIEFTDADGTRSPATWLRTSTLEEKTAIGITEAPEPERYDDRFYWGVGNPKLLDDREEVDQDGKPMFVKVYDPKTESMVDSTERLVTKGLKSNWVAQIKDTAGKLLAQTDWMIIRKVERAVEIPAKVEAYRAAVIAEANRLESDILACKDVEELITVIGQQEWPRDRV